MSAGQHLRGGAEDRAQALAREQEPLLEVIKRELRERGYFETEEGRYGCEGGKWKHSEDGAYYSGDKILPTLEDCFNRESPLD